MQPTDEPTHRTLGAVLLAWWHGWKGKPDAVAELTRRGSEATRIARGVGVPRAEFRVLAAKRPDYYPNADTLRALATEAEDAKAIARIARRQARRMQ
jgi:hypothetical protein